MASDSPLAAALQPGKPSSNRLRKRFFLSWENRLLFIFFRGAASLEQIHPGCRRDRMPEQMEQRVLANPPFVPNK